MTILGIDPGTATTGFGIIEKTAKNIILHDFGQIRTHKSLSLPERLREIAGDLERLIERWNPSVAAVEKIYFAKNAKTAISVAHSRGVILETLLKKQLSIAEYTPLQVKVSVCSDGRADKKSVQKMVKLLLKLSDVPKPDDAADAIAIALCHAARLRL